MNINKDLAYFNLSGIDSRLGYEKHRSQPREIDSVSTVVITFVINAYFDLFLASDLEVIIKVPQEYHLNGGIRVFIESRDGIRALRDCNPSCILESGELQLVGMDKVKYPFPVWFYATRRLFVVQKSTKWSNAVLLAPEFQIIDANWPQVSDSDLRLWCGAGRTRGKRNYMEDIDFVFDSIKINENRSISVFGVLDGHGGKECAAFCAEDIPVRIAARMRNGSSCPDALFHSFLDSDAEFLDNFIGGNAGSTANIAVYDKLYNVCYIANTGDTRAVLCRQGGQAADLSFDRKGSDPEEIARVASAGGFVSKGRIMGSLAVSRALGKEGVVLGYRVTGCVMDLSSPEFEVMRFAFLMSYLFASAQNNFLF
jgi:serine/threonine protein phosphatase PrpC